MAKEQNKECREWIQEEGISTEEQARRRLRSKQPARRSLKDDETVSKRLKREATIAAIKQEILKNAAERPDLEQAHKLYLCNNQNIEESRVDSCIENGGDQQVARKELLKG